jgi:hypothetical protein
VAISWVVYTKGNLAPDSFTVNGVEYLQGSEQYNEGIKIMKKSFGVQPCSHWQSVF